MLAAITVITSKGGEQERQDTGSEQNVQLWHLLSKNGAVNYGLLCKRQ